MKYMLLVYSPESAWTKQEWQNCVETSSGICRELAEKGQLITATPLHPVATAQTVRVRQGTVSITTGPFAETAEQLGGFFLIDVPDLDEAIQIASRLPGAKKGTVEIRPVIKLAGVPEEQFQKPVTGHNLRFMFLCYDNEQAWQELGEASLRAAMEEATNIAHQLNEQGMYISASPLHPSTMATCVRIRGGHRTISDGHFAETHELLGGYYLVEAKLIDQAMQFAQLHPGAKFGSVEVRQVFDVQSLIGSSQT